MNKKILIYNWAEFDDRKGRGGGVSVVLRNIIPELVRRRHQVIFVSAGCHYTLPMKKTIIQEYSNVFDSLGVVSYRILNSPIKAPAHDAFYEVEQCLNDEPIVDAMVNLFTLVGYVDEVHFHGFEGISTKILERIKRKSLAKKTFVWFHNYHLVCPQLNLFRVSTLGKCFDYGNGEHCIDCIARPRNQEKLKRIQSVISFVELNKRGGGKIARKILEGLMAGYRLIRHVSDSLLRERLLKKNINSRKDLVDVELNAERARMYRSWREQNLLRLEKYVDHCYAVSEQTRTKIINIGVPAGKCTTIPLGMDVFVSRRECEERSKLKSRGTTLRLGFLGNALPEKGLWFLLSCISSCRQSVIDQLEIKIYSRLSEQEVKRICEARLPKLTVDPSGYERSDLAAICEGVDVVIVPSLWWETFNQVAYEATSFGVPVVFSDSVGVGTYLNKKFEFQSGNALSLTTMIESIVLDEALLINYWRGIHKNLPSLDDTISHLEIVSKGEPIS